MRIEYEHIFLCFLSFVFKSVYDLSFILVIIFYCISWIWTVLLLGLNWHKKGKKSTLW